MKTIDLKNIWKDPVWSKVIAAGLIFIFSQILILIGGWIGKLNFIEVYQYIYKLLVDKYQIYGWVLTIGIVLISYAFWIIFRQISLQRKIKLENSGDDKPIVKVDEPEELSINEAPTVFFHHRFCDAFPGFDSGYRWFTSNRDINNRLKILLAHPTKFKKADGYGITTDPIWWFRGQCHAYKQI